MTVPEYYVEPANVAAIDLQALISEDEVIRKDAVGQLDVALQTFGFVQILNHGIPNSRVDQAFDWSKRFFDLPVETKRLVARSESGALADHLGWAREGLGQALEWMTDAEAEIARNKAVDRKETLELGNPRSTDLQPNPWVPEDVFPGFRDFVESWWDDCASVAHTLLHALGEALKVPDPGCLSRLHQNHDVCHLTWNSYASMPLRSLVSNEAARLGAHTDFGTITLVFQDSVGGLEVHDGTRYRPIIPLPGAVLVNVGDMLESQSNGRWKSSLHRVVAPGQVQGSKPDAAQLKPSNDHVLHRYSMVWFAAPSPNELIQIIPGCETPGRWRSNIANSNAVVTARQWIEERLAVEY